MDSTPSELYDDPIFEPGDKVRSLKAIRNDGTFPGVRRGDYLLDAGEIGYVKSIGTYLNRFYIYTIDFVDRGILLGMRSVELEGMEDPG